MSAGDWNPYYLTYAAASGLSPEAMLHYDSERFPGGKMCGFIIWMSQRWQEWDALNKHRRDHVRFPEEHTRFGEWLKIGIRLQSESEMTD